MTVKQLDPSKIRRILIRSTNWVGDAVLTTPAVRAVRKNFPAAKISILAKPWVAPVFFNNPYVDNIVLYASGERRKGWLGKARLVMELRREKFDLAVLFQNAFEAALLAYMAGIPYRLGYDTDCRRALLTHSVHMEHGLKQIHEIDYYLGMLERASLEPDGRELALVVSDQDSGIAGDILARHGIAEQDSVIGINPGATYGSAKRWPVELYAELCEKVQAFWGSDIIIFGGADDETTGWQISELTKARCINLCGRTTLSEAIGLIEKCEMFISNDSGLMHVAAALEVPLVAVFGPTNPITTGPSGARSRIVRVPVSCSPCLKPECSEDHRCMKEVTVDMVLQSAKDLMKTCRL